MPRGRHRHSPPLHKILPPSVVAAVAVVCAGGVWAVSEPLVVRALAVVAAAAALTGAVIMRSWDREAGRRVADLTRARESDQWKTDERVAELEADAEESREIRTRLDGKLRAKRVELARLRGEHAALLRRYATAETERASALEGRRRLTIEATAEPRELAAGALRPTPSVYLMASRALDELAANGARQAALPAPRGRRAVESGRGPAKRELEPPAAMPEQPPVASRDVRAPGEEPAADTEAAPGAAADTAPASEDTAAAGERPGSEAPALPARPVTPSAIVPYARRTQQRPDQRPAGAGFDFFGTQSGAGPGQHGGRNGAEEPGEDDGGRQHTDAADAAPADAVDAAPAPADSEASADAEGGYATDSADRTADAPEAAEIAAAADSGGVFDLTEHDDTERLEIRALRSALGT